MSPGHLFKYQPYTANSLSSLLTRSIWLAQPSTLNDPFDVSLRFEGELTDEAIQAFYSARTRRAQTAEEIVERRKAIVALHDRLASSLQRAGVASFSESH